MNPVHIKKSLKNIDLEFDETISQFMMNASVVTNLVCLRLIHGLLVSIEFLKR